MHDTAAETSACEFANDGEALIGVERDDCHSPAYEFHDRQSVVGRKAMRPWRPSKNGIKLGQGMDGAGPAARFNLCHQREAGIVTAVTLLRRRYQNRGVEED